MPDEKLIVEVLIRCWSKKSSDVWNENNPAKGQCGVTALVINKLFGGEILKTKLQNGQLHFYNFINGQRFDFTSSQFESKINYDDLPSNREEAFGDTTEEQYRYLLKIFSINYPSEI